MRSEERDEERKFVMDGLRKGRVLEWTIGGWKFVGGTRFVDARIMQGLRIKGVINITATLGEGERRTYRSVTNGD